MLGLQASTASGISTSCCSRPLWGCCGHLRHRHSAQHPCNVRRQAQTVKDGGTPMVTLQFLVDGEEQEIETESGDIVRDAMKAHNIPIYTTWGKISNCNGAGQCGTCIVETLEDPDSLLDPAERDGAELKKLKGKPDSFRLSCQLNVGDGTNSGRVKLRTRPQKK